MKVVIAGSRKLPSLNLNQYKDWEIDSRRDVAYKILEEMIKESGFNITTVVSGNCWGVEEK